MKLRVAISALTWRGVPIAAVLAVVALSPAHAKSPKELFAALSGGIVALLAVDSRGREASRGSGVIVGENHVATDCNVLSGTARIHVLRAADAQKPERTRMLARLTAREPNGLCLLYVPGLSDPPPASPVPFGSARDAAIGDEVYVIGAAEGADLSLSRGMISRLRRDDEKSAAPVIHTDATVLPGFSGAGLFDRQGRLIGILKSTRSNTGGFSPAIPVEGVRELTRSVEAPETRLAELTALFKQTQAALEASEREAEAKGIQIVNLSQRLNAALASKVQELASFRSEFFGRLKQALGDRRDVRIVGDRFVFQSEVLFPSGQATLQPGGRDQIDKLARTITEISANIPTDINWVLRVDGHTDRIPISTPTYPSNWELSTGRAVAVVKYLIDQGVPATRLAATGFGEFQPIDTGDTIAAFRRNRRIEFRLTRR